MSFCGKMGGGTIQNGLRLRSGHIQRKKIFLIRVCRGLRELVGARPLHLLTQTAPPLKSPTGAFIAAQPRPTPNAAFTSGVVTGNIGCTLYRPRSLRQQPSPLSHLRCQLPQRGSSWHSGKVSGLSAKCAVSPEPLPLGEVDANAVSRRRGLARSPQRGCFRRKPALQMPLSSTTPPVKCNAGQPAGCPALL